ncbi:hypothetical protein BsWGS_13156 [Bradybaena similaris]
MTSFYDVVTEAYVPCDQPTRIGRYKIGDIIGKGSSSFVRKGVKDGDKKTLAIKVLNKMAGHHGALIQLQFQQEVEALRRISHSHVVALHDCLQTQRRLYIVLDFISGILLSSYVRMRVGLPEVEAQWFSSQLTSALAYIHGVQVIHRDLKPANVMVDPQTRKVCLIDFGLSACMPGHVTRRCGTPAYMAPEVASSMGYGSAVDMWSLGVSIAEMLMGSPPKFNGLLKSGNYLKLVQRRELFTSLPSLSKECINFLDHLLQIYPERRMTSTEALQHAWIKGARDITQHTQSAMTEN